MTDKKISQLSNATTPLAGTEVLPIVQSSTTVKVASNDLTVRNVRANATTGILQVTGPAAASTRVMTVPDANFTVARTDAGQTFTGVQVMTSPNIVTSINDTNGNELIGITATGSAVNELTVANAATGNNPVVSATGGDTNIGITLTPKGSGAVTVSTGNLTLTSGDVEASRFVAKSGGIALDNGGTSSTIDIDATANIGSLSYGLVMIADTGTTGDIGLIAVGAAGSAVLSQSGSIFTAAQGTSNRINVYFSSGNVTVENKLGSTAVVRVLVFRLQ